MIDVEVIAVDADFAVDHGAAARMVGETRGDFRFSCRRLSFFDSSASFLIVNSQPTPSGEKNTIVDDALEYNRPYHAPAEAVQRVLIVIALCGIWELKLEKAIKVERTDFLINKTEFATHCFGGPVKKVES